MKQCFKSTAAFPANRKQGFKISGKGLGIKVVTSLLIAPRFQALLVSIAIKLYNDSLFTHKSPFFPDFPVN